MTAEHPTASLPPAASFFPQRAYDPGAALCFVHVAKAAGTTVRLMMENAFPGDRVYPSGSPLFAGRYIPLPHAIEAGEDFRRYEALSGHFGAAVAQQLHEGANLFTWLREPGDRAVSEFFFYVTQERQERFRSYRDRLAAGERAQAVFLDWLADGPGGYSPQHGQLAYGNRQSLPPLVVDDALTEAALDALRRCFFIGLMEEQDRSIDALCALTSILPPKRSPRRNSGTNRPKRLDFTAEEQAKFDALLAPDRAFYALARDIYGRQMAELAGRDRSEPALALIGDREGLRRHILDGATARTPLLTTWKAWDPVLGENLDGREQLGEPGNVEGRWRWTASSPDTFLYFRLPRRTAFELRLRLAPATPPGHAEQATLTLSGEGVPLTVTRTPDDRTELLATIPVALANRLPELAELHLHTALMLDERTLVPYAGTRRLGLAIEEISATPIPPLTLLWRRLGGPRVAGLTRSALRRLYKS